MSGFLVASPFQIRGLRADLHWLLVDSMLRLEKSILLLSKISSAATVDSKAYGVG